MGIGIPAAGGATKNSSASGAQVIDGSLLFQSSLSQYVQRTFTAGNRQTWTFSAWVKKTSFGSSKRGLFGYDASNDHIRLQNNDDGGDSMRFVAPSVFDYILSRKDRDNGWFHLVVACDTTDGTAGDRVKIYYNGELQTAFYSSSNPSQNANTGFNQAGAHSLGCGGTGGDKSYADAGLSNVYWLDGYAVGADNFGYTDPLTNTWRPKKYEGTFNAPQAGLGGVTWSDYVSGPVNPTYPLSKCFTGTIGSSYSSGTRPTVGNTLTLNIAALNLDVTNVRLNSFISRGPGGGGAPSTYTVNGTTVSIDNSDGDQTNVVAVNGQLNTIAWSYDSTNGPYVYMRGIEVDLGDGDGYQLLTDGAGSPAGINGFYLPLDGNSPIGKDLSKLNPINNGTTWSSTGTLDTNPANAFDGNISNYAGATSGTKYILNNVSVKINSSLRVYHNFNTSNGCKFQVNGSDVTITGGGSGSFAWSTLNISSPLTLTSLALVSTTSNSIAAVEVDGVVLQDGMFGNSFTPVAFGGSNVIPKATGALPILNTVNGGNVSSVGVRTDAYHSNLVFAAPMNGGVAYDVSNQINSGSTAKAITTNGDPEGSSNQSNFYGSSFYSDGTGDYFNTATSSDFAFGTGDFTIECWVYHTAAIDAGDGIFQISTGSGGYNPSDSNTLTLQTSSSKYMGYANDATADYITPNIINKWTHLALVRKSSVTNLYVNGVKSPTNVSDSKNYTGTYLGIGIYYGTSYVWQGYMQDFRVYKGVAKYTENFIPASTNPDIFPDTPSGVALGSPLTKLSDITTTGSVKFNGQSQGNTINNASWLDVGDSADYNLGTGDFTIEMWVRIPKSSRSQNNTLFATRGAAGSVNGFNIGIFEDPSGRRLYMYSNGQRLTYANVVPTGWTHIAVTRESNALKSFINGALEGTGTTTQDFSNTSAAIGSVNTGTAENTLGYISNFRLIKGTALYTANFTPPAAPLTNVTNTKLLCCQDPNDPTAATVAPDAGSGTALLNIPLSSTPFADSSSTSATVTNTGSIAAASAGTNNFDITNAASLNGSSQRLSTNNTNLTFTGSWTFDAWFKLDSSASGYNALFNSGYGASSSPYMYLSINDDEKPYVEGGSAGGATTATNAINKNQWYHMRVTSDGTKIRQYIDGELVVTHGANSTDLSSAGTKTIGSLLDNGNNANNFHGLIGPVRYVSSNLGVPPVGGLKTSSGALSNTPDVPDIISPGGVDSSFFNPYMTEDIDTVMGQESSYPTLNPVSRSQALTSGQNPGTAPARLTNNNLTVDTNGLTNDYNMNVTSTFGMTSGKFYCEYLHTYSSTGGGLIGISPGAFLNGHYAGSSGYQPGGSDPNTENAYGMYMWNRGILHENTYNINGTASNYHSRVAQYSIVGIALDMDNYKCWWSVDGVWQQYPNCGLPYPDPETGKDAPAWGFDDTSDTWYFCWTTTGGESGTFNFGQQPFKYTPPKGFGPPNLANTRPSTVITRPDKYVAVTTYAGDGTSVIVRDFQFKPDFVWLKGYTDPDKHGLYDTVRGATERLISSATTEEQNHNGVVSFDDKGFNVGNYAETNGSGRGYVAWAWKAGGNKGTWNKNGEDVGSLINAGLNYGDTAKLNGASVGTRQGFSIVKWTQDGGGAGSQIAHGLTQAPNLVIMKHLNATSNWFVTHTSLSAATKVLYLNDDTEEDTSSDFGNTFPGATYTTTSTTGVDGREVIMYSWHDVPGLQKFGKYKGNGNADGPYVDLGFRPALLWVKDITDDWSWYVIDNKRSPYNVTSKTLKLNTDDDQDTSTQYNCFDFLSTGFKVRAAPSNSEPTNDTADTYVYCAWAESPASNLYGGHSDAR